MMITQRNISVSFTGHRYYAGEADVQLCDMIRRLYDEGFTRFLCGMAWGFDLAAGETVARLKEDLKNVELVAVVPYAEFRDLFHGSDAEHYERVMAAADEIVVVSECGGDAAFRRRNDYLVDNASVVVAWFDGVPRGGTAYTIRRARHSRLPVVNLMHNPQLELF